MAFACIEVSNLYIFEGWHQVCMYFYQEMDELFSVQTKI